MANIIDIQTIVDGERNVVIKVYLASDGSSGDVTNISLVDASVLVPIPTTLRLVSVTSDLTGFTVNLSWASTANDPLVHLAVGKQQYFWRKFGGIPNPKTANFTGDMLLSSTGFGVAGDAGFVIVECVKH